MVEKIQLQALGEYWVDTANNSITVIQITTLPLSIYDEAGNLIAKLNNIYETYTLNAGTGKYRIKNESTNATQTVFIVRYYVY